MSTWSDILVLTALLGAATVGGVFFAFSSFIMRALANLPPAEGISAMQSINVVVLNRSFLGLFVGTTAICVPVAALSVAAWPSSSSGFLFAGAFSYVFGVFFVTGIGNVPLNKQLAIESAVEPGAVSVWKDYLKRWTALNTIRTVFASLAAVLLGVGLMTDGVA